MKSEVRFEVLPGLPPYGPTATPVPAGWGGGGREGVVVRVEADGRPWTANVQPGLGGVTAAIRHPNGVDVLVFAGGDCWTVDGAFATSRLATAVEGVLCVPGTPDLILNCQGLSLCRIDGTGRVWRTRRLSWDGLNDLRVEADRVVGRAWDALNDCWQPFAVDLRTGRTQEDHLGVGDPGWEQLADSQDPGDGGRGAAN